MTDPDTRALAGVDIDDLYGLSPVQEGIFFHCLRSASPGLYAQQFTCTLHGPLDVGAFEEAWRATIARHPALRSAFVWEGLQRPLQAVVRNPIVPWVVEDWQARTDRDRQQAWQALRAADEDAGYVLDRAPLLRFRLVRVAPDAQWFLWSYHHLLLDGWSVALVVGEVRARYAALVYGSLPDLAECPPYREYIRWLQHRSLPQAEAYWRARLHGITAPTPVPSDRPKGSSAGLDGPFVEEQAVLSEHLSERVQRYAQDHRITVSTLTLGAWAMLLGRCTGATEVLIGTTVSGRPPDLPGIETMVGLFINTVPVRISVSPRKPVQQWLAELQLAQAEARQYESSPLVDIQGWSHIPRGTPLFDIVFVCENYPHETGNEPVAGVRIEQAVSHEPTHYALTMIVKPGARLRLQLGYDARHVERHTVRRLLDRYERLLGEIVADPWRAIERVPSIDAAERQAVVHTWNETRTVFADGDRGLGELVERALVVDPERVAAVMDGGARWSAATLLTEARRIAAWLIAAGVRLGAVVGICEERSLARVAAVLGVVGAGAAYLPLDPSYPVARLRQMLDEARPAIVLVGPDVPVTGPDAPAGTRLVPLDACATQPPGPFRVVRGLAPAYVIYTSGSTGRPKGAVNTHAGIVNRLLWMQAAYPLGAGDAVLQKTPFGFDVSVWEFFWPVLASARLVVAAPGVHADPEALAALVQRERVTTMHFVPSMLGRYLEAAGAAGTDGVLRHVIASGEALPRATVQRFHAMLPNVALHNLYGPTEAAIDVTAWTCDDAADADVPIGRPIANTRVYVLDAALQPVGVGMPGDLYLGGLGLALGYYGQGARTAQQFVPDPFAQESGGRGMRLYDTGDRAQWRGDAALQYLGRRDGQVKLRGNRVELGEIERVLATHPTVQQAAARVQAAAGNEPLLVAYVTPATVTSTAGAAANDATPQPAELRRWLATQLPAFMVPSAIVVLDALPLSPNGKLDRRALPQITLAAPDSSYVAPQSAFEQQLGTVWQEVLQVARVGRHDNFFDLGGHSLAMITLLSRLRSTLQRDLSMVELFEYPTIAALSAYLAHGGDALAADGQEPSDSDRSTRVQTLFSARKA